MSAVKGWWWCPERKDYQRWDEHIAYYKKQSQGWKSCGCTQLQTASGNGCLQCNPEKAYEIAKQLSK
jgi:hypothetical protein